MTTTTDNPRTNRRREWTKQFRSFSPARLRLGYRAIKQRCLSDKGFKRACVAALVANSLLTLVFFPLGLFSFWFGIVHVMPRNILMRQSINQNGDGGNRE